MAGGYILEVLIARALTGIVAVGLLAKAADNRETLRARLVTQHMGEFGSALSDYAKKNAVLLIGQTAGGPVTVTVATLQASGDLSQRFQTTNVAGQTPVGLVTQPVGNALELFGLETGGVSMNDARASAAAANAGARFGAYRASVPATVNGAGNVWRLQTSVATAAGINPTPGSIAFRTYMGVNAAISDFLSRIDTGNPESARMHQSIDMNGNNLNNIGDGTIQAMGVQLSSAVYSMDTVASGSSVPIPTCNAGKTPDISLAQSTTHDSGAGDLYYNVSPYYVSSPPNYVLHLLVQTQAGSVIDPPGTTILYGTRCK